MWKELCVQVHSICKSVGKKYLDDLLLLARFWVVDPVDTLLSSGIFGKATETVGHMTVTTWRMSKFLSYYIERHEVATLRFQMRLVMVFCDLN